MRASLKRQTQLAAASFLLIGCMASPSSPQNPVPSGNNVILNWTREGGFAGFCDEMKITTTGEISTSSCRPPGAGPARRLTTDDQTRLDQWKAAFGSVAIESKDSAGTDGMTVKLAFQGSGSRQPTQTERQELLEWTQRVYTQSRA